MYGIILRSQLPIDAYQALHKKIMDIVGSNDPTGLLVHYAYPTDAGFDMVEIWESKEYLDAFNRDVVSQAVEQLDEPMGGPPPEMIEFDPVEVITPRVYTPTSR
jgi:hypothetical protein